MPLIPFPAVMNFPGVPELPKMPGVDYLPTLVLGGVQSVLYRSLAQGGKWGVFDASGNPVHGIPDDNFLSATFGVGGTSVSVASFDFTNENKISDFPIERGSFAQFNKVETPATAKVPLTITGTEDDRRRFLDAIDKAAHSIGLYSVVTPERRYLNYTIQGYNYSRKAMNGLNMLTVTIDLMEIREVSAAYTSATLPTYSAKAPDDAPAVNTGSVQPKQSILQQGWSAVKGLFQ